TARLAGFLTAGLAAVRRPVAARRGGAGPAAETALPGVFLAGPGGVGPRPYLTRGAARPVAAGWAALGRRVGDRVENASRRPAGAVPFKLVVLGRQVPDLATARE